MTKKSDIAARVLSPNEYPVAITARRGAYTPQVLFAVQHPLGLYHIEDHGADVHTVYFTARRAKRPKIIGNARDMTGAFRIISEHEDQLIHPTAEREEGKHGPVSIYALGRRTGEPKPKSQLDQELDAWLDGHGYRT